MCDGLLVTDVVVLWGVVRWPVSLPYSVCSTDDGSTVGTSSETDTHNQ